MTSIVPPSIVRGMKQLNRELFNTTIIIPSLKVRGSKISEVLKYLKKYFLRVMNLKPVITNVDSSSNVEGVPIDAIKNVYLNPSLLQSWSDIKVEDREKLLSNGITEDSFQNINVELKYENWKADEILKAVLPSDKESVTGYSNIGHIVHVNLKDHLLEYKEVIGQVLLDKVKGCETVVNKTNTIDNTYRNFQMEVLCGKADFQAKLKENNCTFEFDFSKVYWNSRLSTEHLRIINTLKKDDILFDVFAGVGPFAIPCARKKCIVYANDLNPESYKWLVHNAKINNIKSKFQAFNLDGKDFICNIVPENLFEIYSSDENMESNIYFVMNLPAMAVEFLQYFRGVLKDYDENKMKNFKQPIVNVYCFVAGENCEEEAKKLVEDSLQYDLNDNLINVFYVRNVAPNKEMMRVTFSLTKEVLFHANNSNKRKRNDSE